MKLVICKLCICWWICWNQPEYQAVRGQKP